MLPFFEDITKRAFLYAQRQGLETVRHLGDGKDGIVFSAVLSTPGTTAVKVFARLDLYARELACYQRLAECGLGGPVQVCGHNVPQLIGHDNELMVIEMTVVTKPYILDFAGAYLDEPPDFPAEVMEERHAHWAELFEKRWPAVQQIMAEFRRYGIYLLDPSPRNIAFKSEG